MTARGIAALMGFEAATLIVASTLHLAGAVNNGKPPFRPDRAGIAEAIIAAVLTAGAFALARGRRRVAAGTVAFAIAGFIVGLSMTIRGGATVDIAYHATVLPLLLITFAVLVRIRRQPWERSR
jgi:hypothetical protein